MGKASSEGLQMLRSKPKRVPKIQKARKIKQKIRVPTAPFLKRPLIYREQITFLKRKPKVGDLYIVIG